MTYPKNYREVHGGDELTVDDPFRGQCEVLVQFATVTEDGEQIRIQGRYIDEDDASIDALADLTIPRPYEDPQDMFPSQLVHEFVQFKVADALGGRPTRRDHARLDAIVKELRSRNILD